MAASSTPAVIPPSSSATPSPPTPATPPLSTTNPPSSTAVVPPVPSPPIVSPPPASPPAVSLPPPVAPSLLPTTPPPTVPPPTPSIVSPPLPPDSSPPPLILQPPQSSPSPPTVPPPQPSPSPPTGTRPLSAPPPTPVNSPPTPVNSPPPPVNSPPPTTLIPTAPSIVPPPPYLSPTPPNFQSPQSSPSPPMVPPQQPSPSPPIQLTPPNAPPPTLVNSRQSPSDTPSVQPSSPMVKSPPPSDAKTSSISPPPPDILPVSPHTPTTPASPDNSLDTSNFSMTGSSGNSRGGIKVGTIVGIGVGIAAIVVLAALVIFFMKRRKSKGGYDGHHMMPSSIGPTKPDILQISEPASPSAPLVKMSLSSHEFPYSPQEPGLGNSWFTYEELSAITNGFSPQNVLGEGGFGCVYKGCLADGRDVAVKQLKVGGGQGEREFQAEVEIISRVHHRHLVSLVGYCMSENQRLLVYDYVPNNTLHYHLHDKPVMTWTIRVRVAAGAARGIAYLHEDCHPRIIHRDIKSSNILLDNNFNAQVSDFGLAKLTMDSQTHVTTRVMGTFGYMAPEYASSGLLTDRSDVFSFGVVLLELVTGRKPVDASQPVGDEGLVDWARPLMSCALETGDLNGLPDPKLAGNYNENEMLRMIETAAVCVRHSASMRPRMGQVMRVLDDLSENKLDLQNGIRPGQSELFNSGANSADIRLFQRMAFGGPDYSTDFSHATWSSQQDL